MNGIWLDFERPIVELKKKIEELKGLKGVEDEIERLETQVEKLEKRIYSNLSRWQRVQLARHPRRPYSLDILNIITEDFIEMHGDRRFGDDQAIVAGITKLDKYSVAIVAQQKGRDTKAKINAFTDDSDSDEDTDSEEETDSDEEEDFTIMEHMKSKKKRKKEKKARKAKRKKEKKARKVKRKKEKKAKRKKGTINKDDNPAVSLKNITTDTLGVVKDQTEGFTSFENTAQELNSNIPKQIQGYNCGEYSDFMFGNQIKGSLSNKKNKQCPTPTSNPEDYIFPGRQVNNTNKIKYASQPRVLEYENDVNEKILKYESMNVLPKYKGDTVRFQTGKLSTFKLPAHDYSTI